MDSPNPRHDIPKPILGYHNIIVQSSEVQIRVGAQQYDLSTNSSSHSIVQSYEINPVPYGTDGRLFATDVSVNFKAT